MDATSFLSGIGLGILGAFGAGLFKKAGEECFNWIKKKINPKSAEHHAPQLIIQLNGETRNQSVDGANLLRLEPASIERISSLKFDDISQAIEAAPPLQRDRVAESYKGLRVEWDTYFKSGSQVDGDLFRLRLRTKLKGSFDTVKCEVPAKEYRELGILPEGSKIRVSGEIESASMFDIELKDVRLYIF
jgi:hypothetical protein